MAATPKTKAAPAPEQPAQGYEQVTIQKTDTVNGHVYKRGAQPFVDAATKDAMTKQGML